MRAGTLTREQAKVSPYKNVVTSALGGHLSDRQVRGPLKVLSRDALVLCTDGVHGPLVGADVVRCLAAKDPAQALVEAGQAAGSRDDATAIVLLGPRYVSQPGLG